eukprot:TRINITY_DN11216_c0_g1_i1.p1 TRINITY_DN11216_c0_g1~~TRINITY_DN11216_c0_g1_i1.p1  ORF type:complete len:397 (-),score=99.00 TRINITY_DN11216_c0_g1_i1:124-1314(-)
MTSARTDDEGQHIEEPQEGAVAKMPRFRRLDTAVLNVDSVKAPSSSAFLPRDIVSAMWNRLGVDEAKDLMLKVGSCKVAIISGLTKCNPTEVHDIHVKAELLLFFWCGEERVRGLPRLPEERARVMLEDARRVPQAVMDHLSSLRERLAANSAFPVAMPTWLPSIVEGGRSQADTSGQEGNARGQCHEMFAEQWARTRRWSGVCGGEDGEEENADGEEILSSCFIVGVRRDAGVKQEFDSVVVDRDGRVVAIVEAKAGAKVYQDFSKLLEARDTFFPPGSKPKMKEGKSGPVREFFVGDAPPHLAYVFGSSENLDRIVEQSASFAEVGIMLKDELSVTPLQELRLTVKTKPVCRAVVDFSASPRERCRKRLGIFFSHICQLAAAGEVSFWGAEAIE